MLSEGVMIQIVIGSVTLLTVLVNALVQIFQMHMQNQKLDATHEQVAQAAVKLGVVEEVVVNGGRLEALRQVEQLKSKVQALNIALGRGSDET